MNSNDLDKQKIFDDYIKDFVFLDLNQKKEMVIADLKEMLGIMMDILVHNDKKPYLLLNREITDKSSNEEDFVESVYVYLQSLKELLADYLEDKIK